MFSQPIRIRLFPTAQNNAWKAVPGALAVLAAVGLLIALPAAMFDPELREQSGTLWILLAIMGAGTWCHFRFVRKHRRTFTLECENGQLKGRLEDRELALPIHLDRGIFEEISGRGRFVVTWISVSTDSDAFYLRRRLGLLDPVPDWPQKPPPEGAVCYRGAVFDLQRYLEWNGIR